MHSSSPLPSPSQLLGMLSSSTKSKGGRVTPIPADAIEELESTPSPLSKDLSPSRQRLGLADKHGLLKSSKIARNSGWPKEKENKPPIFRKPLTLVMDNKPVQESEPAPESNHAPEPNPAEATASPAPQAAISDIIPPKRSRRKKGQIEENGQTKLKNPRITKPGAIKDVITTKKYGPPKRPKENRSAERLLSNAVAKKRATFAPEELPDLGLKEATRRRVDWTPPRDTIAPVSVEMPLSNDAPLTEKPIAVLPKARFGGLLDEYRFAPQNRNTAIDKEAVRMTPEGTTVKKRKIELVNGIISAPLAPEKAQSTKSPKKKLQTITAKATEEFTMQSNSTRTLTEYLMPPPDTIIVGDPKQKSSTKNTRPRTKKKSAVTVPIVLSPKTAMKATRNQDFVFGTSSQLVREEFPTFIRDHQQVIKQSESAVGLLIQSVASSSMSLQMSSSIALTPSRSLWLAATRDADGSMLEAEFVDLADTPKPQETVGERPAVRLDNEKFMATRTEPSNVWHDIADISSPVQNLALMRQSNLEQKDVEAEQPLPQTIAEKALRQRPRSTSPKKRVNASEALPNVMPNYQGFTDSQLAKEIKAYGFKPVVKRKARMALLQKCWESKKSTVLQELPSQAIVPQLSKDSPRREMTKSSSSGKIKSSSPAKKRGRPSKAALAEKAQDEVTKTQTKKPIGRPKKDSSVATPPAKRKRNARASEKTETTAVAGDEIYDSAPPTPSPPRRGTPSKPPKALTLSPSANNRVVTESVDSKKITSEGRDCLFAAIRRAITAQAPTNDPENLSWRERILMYEPIVIEDLTQWLNAEGLAKIDEDDEVWTALVKEWCESQSICCLWKENLRGLPRARW